MRIVLSEIDCIWEDKKKNRQICIDMVHRAKELGGDLILFPEMTLTGFSMNVQKTGEYIENNHSETIDFFCSVSKREQIGIGFGIVEKSCEYSGKKAWNDYYIVDKQGEVLSCYRKIHPFTYGEEGLYFLKGNQFTNIDYEDVKIATFICYDLRFPELFQIAGKDSHCIIVPANWPSTRQNQFVALLKARAIETQCYVAGINRVGKGGGLSYTGGSCVFDPYGNEISKKYDMNQGQTLYVADLSKQLVQNYRNEFNVKADRQEEFYKQFY